MRSMCHLVPALVLSAPTSGCFLFHGADDAPPPSPAPDAGPPEWEDAGRPWPEPGPTPVHCPEMRGMAVCLPSFLVAPGRNFVLPVSMDAIGCCRGAPCTVGVDAATRTITLETSLCDDACDCLGGPVTSECGVPALEEGLWDVVANGAPAFQLPVFADSGRTPPPAACAGFAEPDLCPGADPLDDASGHRADDVCAVSASARSRSEIVVRSNCATCTDREGSCHVTLVPRTTRDLPPGADLEVVPRRYTTACDVTCDDSCMPREKRCLTPTLEPGAFYRVFVDGEVVMSFVEAPGSTVCASAVGG